MSHSRRAGSWATGPSRTRRIGGFYSGGREADISARMEGLRLFTQADAARMVAALRAMRRAKNTGSAGYDPARHAALLRLLKRTAPPGRAAQEDHGK